MAEVVADARLYEEFHWAAASTCGVLVLQFLQPIPQSRIINVYFN